MFVQGSFVLLRLPAVTQKVRCASPSVSNELRSSDFKRISVDFDNCGKLQITTIDFCSSTVVLHLARPTESLPRDSRVHVVYVYDFECDLLTAGVCESDRWLPSKATHQTDLQGRNDIPTKAESQTEERPKKEEQTEQPKRTTSGSISNEVQLVASRATTSDVTQFSSLSRIIRVQTARVGSLRRPANRTLDIFGRSSWNNFRFHGWPSLRLNMLPLRVCGSILVTVKHFTPYRFFGVLWSLLVAPRGKLCVVFDVQPPKSGFRA